MPENENALPIVALDCEMSYTTGGMELTRITCLDFSGKIILDELCRPFNRVLDLNSRWSGISSLDEAKFDLFQIKKKLEVFAGKDTIFLGHGLENDMKALRIIHCRVIDTIIVFPHHRGLPYRNSLKRLAKEILGKDIQTSVTGHDSVEDAFTCIELLRKLENKHIQTWLNCFDFFNAEVHQEF